MTDLPKAMGLLRTVFKNHAGKDGDPKSLNKKELSELLRAEFPEAGVSRRDVAWFSKESCECFFDMFWMCDLWMDDLFTTPIVFLSLVHIQKRIGQILQVAG